MLGNWSGGHGHDEGGIGLVVVLGNWLVLVCRTELMGVVGELGWRQQWACGSCGELGLKQ